MVNTFSYPMVDFNTNRHQHRHRYISQDRTLQPIPTGGHDQWCAPPGPDRDTFYFAQPTAPPTGHGISPPSTVDV
jgi:hypothetical protein